MPLNDVTCYRIECDEEGCTDSPQDGGDHYCWTDPSTAVDEAIDCGWFVGPAEHPRFLCTEHRPTCCHDECDESAEGACYPAVVCKEHSEPMAA